MQAAIFFSLVATPSAFIQKYQLAMSERSLHLIGDKNPYSVQASTNPIAAPSSEVSTLNVPCESVVLPLVSDKHDVEIKLEEKVPDEKERIESPTPVNMSAVNILKYTFSFGLLTFSVIVVVAAIFSKQTVATDVYKIHPAVAFFVFLFLIVWLAMIEGGQGALVGLQPIDRSLYADSHPRAVKCTALAHKGDNMERFIVGRQFLTVMVLFVINLMATSVDDPNVFDLRSGVTKVFLENGVAVILTTIIFGQLTAQVNSAKYMLDFINNYFMLFTEYVSLAIEKSGLLHAVYLVQILFSKVTGMFIDCNEPPRSPASSALFWTRVCMSVVILGFAFAVTLAALFQEQTNMWDGVPPAISVVALFILMALVGVMEGMQIALFAVVNMPEAEIASHATAARNCHLISKGQNLQAFLIGRQICVTCCMFIVARITSVNVDLDDPNSRNIFGVSDTLQRFFNTGLLGAVITTIVASLIWRIIASSFPVVFLSNPLIYIIIRACILLETSGVGSSAWLLAKIHQQVIGYQLDVVYIGQPEKRSFSDENELDLELDSAEIVDQQ
jgi:Silicon transporter